MKIIRGFASLISLSSQARTCACAQNIFIHFEKVVRPNHPNHPWLRPWYVMCLFLCPCPSFFYTPGLWNTQGPVPVQGYHLSIHTAGMASFSATALVLLNAENTGNLIGSNSALHRQLIFTTCQDIKYMGVVYER